MKKVKALDSEGNVVKEYYDRKSIEKAIAEYDIGHFRQAFESKACEDRMHEQLRHNNGRDKILPGELEVEECSSYFWM